MTFSAQVRHMAATKSLLGVTTKDVVVATTTDQLVTINRRLIDPRRPDANRVTESDKEEGLFPYDPRLGIPHTAFLTQNSSVPRLRAVLSFPDLLESNSLVFAIGLDLLWIPVSPAKNFDMLRHDFSRVGLFVSVILARSAAIYNPFSLFGSAACGSVSRLCSSPLSCCSQRPQAQLGLN